MSRSLNKKILITGVSGLLGNNLAYYFKNTYRLTGLYFNHPVIIPGVETRRINLLNYPEVRALVLQLRPDVVIHCASRTDVDRIEEEKEDGWQANVLTTRVLLDALRDMDLKLIHISTDSVYSGDKGPYSEDMETVPRNWYGKTKLESERLVSQRPDSLILRTNLYGWNIQNKLSLAEWFLAGLQSGEGVSGFSNAHFSSIYTFCLAEIMEKCLKRNLSGIYNCACRDSWTKYEFGRKIAEMFSFDPQNISPISLDEIDFKARRGKDLRLDVRRLEKALGQNHPTMTESLKRFHRDWKSGFSKEIKRGLRGELKIFYPKRDVINYGGQYIDQSDIDAVVKVLKSPNLTQGREVTLFEEEIAYYVGAQFGVAISSGTAALHLACLACGVTSGNDGITSPITFLASANAIVYCGATPRFADIDPRTYNISPDEFEKRITEKTQVVIPVHFAGQSCSMREIRDVVADKEKRFGRKISIVEDASHALGSLYEGRKVGCCKYADAAVFSFHPVKHITTGEGGMVVTNSRNLAEKIRQLRSHGMTRNPDCFINKDLAFTPSHPSAMNGKSVNPWYYEQTDLGFNYRITDVQCALGRSQLSKLPWFRDRRLSIVAKYNEAFSSIRHITTPYESPDCVSNFHLYILKIDFDALGISRKKLVTQLAANGIYTQVHYIPLHLQPYYQRHFGTGPGDCPKAERYYEQCLSLPLYPAMDNLDVEKVIECICRLLEKDK